MAKVIDKLENAREIIDKLEGSTGVTKIADGVDGVVDTADVVEEANDTVKAVETVEEVTDVTKTATKVKDGVGGIEGGTDIVTGIKLPQGISAETFSDASKLIDESIGGISDDIVVQGSRASGTPNSGTAKERTMLHAIETGKIQAGEAGLRRFRKDFWNGGRYINN